MKYLHPAFFVVCLILLSLVGIATGQQIEAGTPGASLLARDTLTTAFSILNRSGSQIDSLEIKSISIDNGTLISPAKLPLELGPIADGDSAAVYAQFKGGPYAGAQAYIMKVSGSYRVAGTERPFTLDQKFKTPPDSPGSGKSGSASVAPHSVKKGPPTQPLPIAEDKDNEDAAPAIPIGPVLPGEAPGEETTVDPAPAPGVDPNGFQSFRECIVSGKSGLIHGGSLAEPSGGVSGSGDNGDPSCAGKGAKGSRVVFATANSFAAFSADSGAAFTQVAFSGIANFDGSLCCDQVVQFVPKINRLVWTMLVKNVPGSSTTHAIVRLMAASPDEIINHNAQQWTVWDFTSGMLGLDPTQGFDFPGMAVGDNSLYLNFDGQGGFIVCRIKLSEIAAGGTLHFRFTNPADSPLAGLGHVTEDPQDEVFWAQHDDNTDLRVFSWRESSDTYFWRVRQVPSWPADKNKMSSLTKDCKNWLARTGPGRIRGAARFKGSNKGRIFFAWTASSGDSFSQPHVRLVELNPQNNFNVVDHGHIFNTQFAFGYPALATNTAGELGLALEAGGGSKGSLDKCDHSGSFQNFVVGFQGDGKLHRMTHSVLGLSAYGDYITLHRDAKNSGRFDAFGYGMEKDPNNASSIIAIDHFVIFGRPPQ
jgi:hypothetical protein